MKKGTAGMKSDVSAVFSERIIKRFKGEEVN